MGNGEIDDKGRIGSVKVDAVKEFDERFVQDSGSMKKPQMEFRQMEVYSGAKELHMARRDIARFKNRRRAAEFVKSQAESELSDAKKTVKVLSSLLEESNSKANARLKDVEREVGVRNVGNHQYAEVMRELYFVKKELSNLKVDLDAVLKEKLEAEKEIQTSSLKMGEYTSSAGALRKEIDEIIEEQEVVELARMEALKEYGAIEVYRGNEANNFSVEMETTMTKMKEIIEEIDRSKELEIILADTMSDADVLQNELKLIKEMDGRSAVTKELEAAKKELNYVREEGFQFMACMDVIRNETSHVMEEKARLKKTAEKSDSAVENLNSKLLRAKSKLESVSAAEEKAQSLLSSLALAMEQSKTESEAAKKEKEIISEETAKIKEEIQRFESEIDVSEEKLHLALQELEAVKMSEALTLDNLKTLVTNTMQARAHASHHSSSITISQFEYVYLTGRAAEADEVADKKVAAAQAWTEAIKSSEKEILMKTEMGNREIREIQVEMEKQVYRTEKSPPVKRLIQGEKGMENARVDRTLSRRSMKENVNLTPARRVKVRKSGSPVVVVAWNGAKPTSFGEKKTRKVIPNLTKYFRGKRVENNEGVQAGFE